MAIPNFADIAKPANDVSSIPFPNKNLRGPMESRGNNSLSRDGVA